ncbi:MAG: Crp/Fnr family transcriptional regulator [Ruminococcus sp.]|nr:Crp/Fnr family transcriptional regulator [Ruminococcus sp.]
MMLTNQDYIYSIRKCYLFDGIEDEQLADAIKLLNGRIKKVVKDDYVVQLGGAMQYAGLLLKGKIESSFQNENFDQITMHTFTGGYLFGEGLVINHAKNSPVQVRAVEDSVVLFIDLEMIYAAADNSPIRNILARNLIKSLAKKNLILNQKVRILSQKSLRDRIFIYLRTLPKDKDGYAKIPFTQTALAEYLGVNRSALSRELGRMQNEGLLVIDGKRIKIISQSIRQNTTRTSIATMN